MLGIPSLAIMDYEHVQGFVRPTWIMTPEVIRSDSLHFSKDRILRYPGIKEDVYVPLFKPDSGIMASLGLNIDELIVTIRPPASEAHYHNPEAEALFLEAVNRIGALENSRMVILPRNDAQKVMLETAWPQWCSERKIIVPDQVVDGLNLLWHSDLAISGGGTMNREAAALGVPVYSIFRGKMGDVDRCLSQMGRLVMLENVKDVDLKLALIKRVKGVGEISNNHVTLSAVVDGIVKILES
jgi:predicted glycosyltransferase